MKVIYPQETLDLLAKYDELINRIAEDYQRSYPEPPDALREILGDKLYAEKYHLALDKRRRAMLEDPIYQACIEAKAKIISLSPCTYQIIIDEARRKEQRDHYSNS